MTRCKVTIKLNFTASMLFALLGQNYKTLTPWPSPLVEGQGTAAIQSDAMATQTACCCLGEEGLYISIFLYQAWLHTSLPSKHFASHPYQHSHFRHAMSPEETCLASRHTLLGILINVNVFVTRFVIIILYSCIPALWYTYWNHTKVLTSQSFIYIRRSRK